MYKRVCVVASFSHLVDIGVEVVVPALATLLPDPTGQVTRDGAPLLRAETSDKLDNFGVLVGSPGALRRAKK